MRQGAREESEGAVTKWEYRALYLDLDDFSLNEAEERLNALGAEGWELVRAPTPVPGVTTFCIFKRAIPGAPRSLFVYHDPTPQTRDFGKEESGALEFYYCDGDDSDRWHDTWQKLDADERMRD